MKTKIIFIASLALLLSGCVVVPVNLSYESARMLDKGQIQLQGSYSRYNAVKDTSANLCNNFGFAAGFGISEKYSLGIRYEHLDMTPAFGDIFDSEDTEEFSQIAKMNYLEINNRIQIKEDFIAIGIPAGLYLVNEINGLEEDFTSWGYAFIDPRIYFTFFAKTDVFELSIVPKAHIIFGFLGAQVIPGISLGIGLSSDLNKWAIRPEIGYDKYLSFGVGVNFNINTIK
jgi:hypothetical protein